MKYHSLDDSRYEKYIKENVPEALRPKYTLCIKIIKDADALDRVRFGIRDLDINYLRTEEAKKMTLVAQQALASLKLQ